MITQWHHGMKHEVSVNEFRMHLFNGTAKAMRVHAVRHARKIANTVRGQLERKVIDWDLANDTMYLRDLARKYAVSNLLMAECLEKAKELIRG